MEAAGEQFRGAGYGGTGVDGLARAAGVTSGAFYVHFDSKAAAFRQALQAALDEVDRQIASLQGDRPTSWWAEFVELYTGDRRRAELAHGCGLQILAPEVARCDRAVMEQFESGLRAIATTIAGGPPAKRAPRTADEALTALSLLIGAVTLARAVADPHLADQIADAACRSLL
jgi:TetR/AcrR family transcriptional repressor of nem operon